MCRDLFGSPGLGLVTALVNTRRNLLHVLAVGLVHNLNFQGCVAWRKKIGLHTRIQNKFQLRIGNHWNTRVCDVC